ncbi:MAG: ankyrin repeat domain-containing protein [Rhodocyclaceae bacterium]|nr:ankyrin repeat domain-containing protein [Rhodocyclaceae bacterium]
MKPIFFKQLGAMIIAMAMAMPVSAQLFLSPSKDLPSPTEFVTQLEVGDLKQAEAWLDAGLSPDFMGSRVGSGLMIGAWEGNLPLMQLFVARGAKINQVNGNGESAMVLAAWRGNLEAVQWLLERGANINAGHRQWSALHYAVFAGHTEVAEYLMAQGADINALSTNGSSVVMMAIYEGREELARKLIEKGADPRPKNDWGDGALEWAMRFNHLNIARMITNSEEFNIAVSEPKEKWGEPRRSLRSSKTLDDLLSLRATMVLRDLSVDVIDKRIAAERARIVRTEMDRQAPISRAATMEISAERKTPEKQSINIVYDSSGKPVGYKAPPATYFGKPKMPRRSNLNH